jgi:hypothetical protein
MYLKARRDEDGSTFDSMRDAIMGGDEYVCSFYAGDAIGSFILRPTDACPELYQLELAICE